MDIITRAQDEILLALVQKLQNDDPIDGLSAWVEVPASVLQDEIPEGWEHRIKTVPDPNADPPPEDEPFYVPPTIEVVRTFSEYAIGYVHNIGEETALIQIGHKLPGQTGRLTETLSAELYQWLTYFEMTSLEYQDTKKVFVKENIIFVHPTITPNGTVDVDYIIDTQGNVNLKQDSPAYATVAAQFREGLDPASNVFNLPMDITWLIALCDAPDAGGKKVFVFPVTFNTSGAAQFDFHSTDKAVGEYWLREMDFVDVTLGPDTYRFKLVDPHKAKIAIYSTSV